MRNVYVYVYVFRKDGNASVQSRSCDGAILAEKK